MLDISDFLNFKKYSVLEHINEFLNSPTPFGISTSDTYDGYRIFPCNDFQISVKKGTSKEVAIRDVVLYSDSSIYYCHDVNNFESLSTPNCSYYKSNDTMMYKEEHINGVSFYKTASDKSYTSRDDFGKYTCTMYTDDEKSNRIHSFESKFKESEVSNITIQEKVTEDGVVYRSTAFFRMKDIATGRPMMYNIDIFMKGESSEVVISTGYRANYTFTMESPDASLVHLFNNLYTFQFELGFETNEYQIFEILKSNIINKLEYYFKLGGKMNIVNTMLRNIKETM
ncbi:hypothetical protein PSLUR01_00311 [Escherichia phage vB_Eco_slurp01]|uniref:Uncharacterized protein n=1 Tax=Escherichia phage vB_Eco_slurp01 TaxID=1874688 RepID=A0A1C3S6R7_9CAUD|nr:hypothetical protein PSLUR01_00311 [Escherichia phage vB_Eco_slurp01]